MYNSTIATHYAAYRPPLHQVILEKTITSRKKRNIGLDVGCGTGCSTFALKKYCDNVVGIDSSIEMLKQAPNQQTVHFLNASGEKIPISDNSIDVVTIAGSLSYMDRKLLVKEINRICCQDAEIIVYDFEVDLSDFEAQFNLTNLDDSQDYDHQLNLSGFPELQIARLGNDEIAIHPKSSEVAHLLLSDLDRHQALENTYSKKCLFESVQTKIKADDKMVKLKANIYYSLYSLAEN